MVLSGFTFGPSFRSLLNGIRFNPFPDAPSSKRNKSPPPRPMAKDELTKLLFFSFLGTAKVLSRPSKINKLEKRFLTSCQWLLVLSSTLCGYTVLFCSQVLCTRTALHCAGASRRWIEQCASIASMVQQGEEKSTYQGGALPPSCRYSSVFLFAKQPTRGSATFLHPAASFSFYLHLPLHNDSIYPSRFYEKSV